ncbi:transposase [Ampullimonas aquatilis]|uniref:AbiU2 domain-containing protein n=1 Tax=Ampullimonas aquatilis TaxID=1341549 RepID=UPI003C7348B2
MSKHRDFTVQLENLRHEASTVARFFYADMAINHAASKSKVLLSKLNNTPLFWISCSAALQSSAYISLGRIFDTSSKYNISALLDAMEKNIEIFQSPALISRKKDGHLEDPPWLADYIQNAYYPTKKDVEKIRVKVAAYREIYDRAIKPVRHKYLAHREKQDRDEVNALYAAGKVEEIWKLTTFLLQLHKVLQELLINGRKPKFHPIRYSVKTIFDSNNHSGEMHERITKDVKKLMHFIEFATVSTTEDKSNKKQKK